MNDFLELAQKRQSCRKYSAQPVTREQLLRCVEAARCTPSACNSQPWSFVAVQTPETVMEVAKSCQQLGINGNMTTETGPKAFFIVLEEHAVLMPALRSVIDSQYFAPHDVGAATLSLCLEAESLGLGTCVIGLFDREKLSKLLDIPIEKKISMVVAVGYPEDDKVRAKTRKPVEDIVRFV